MPMSPCAQLRVKTEIRESRSLSLTIHCCLAREASPRGPVCVAFSEHATFEVCIDDGKAKHSNKKEEA